MSSTAAPTPKRRGGRPQKYDWSDKRDICYRLFVEEKKSTTEVAEWFAKHFGVDQSQLPHQRDFLRQFQRWGFPPRKPRLSKEELAVLVARMTELWEQSIPAKEMTRIIQSEGWDLEHRDLYKLRKKNGLLLRAREQGYVLGEEGVRSKKRQRNEEDRAAIEQAAAAQAAVPAPTYLRDMPADELAQRVQRIAEVQHESDEKLRTGKRRRRIRGYSHLPPDSPDLAPRYNSETSLDECKAILSLDNDMYTEIREHFTNICTEYGVIKKTLCEPGVWDGAKNRLIREHMHLSALFNPLHPDLDKKSIALENVCADVTKRMRVLAKKVTIAEANIGLGLNPLQSKEVRRTFYDILTADRFQSRLLCGDAHWEELRQQWFASSPVLQQVVAEGDPLKLRMMNMLTRDAMKRFSEDRKRNDPSSGPRFYPDAGYGPGPGPVRRKANPQPPTPEPTVPKVRRTRKPATKKTSDAATTVLDPTLRNTAPQPPLPPPISTQPIPAYFRLAPGSQIVGNHPKMWLGKLAAPTIPALHEAATSNIGAARVAKVQGVVKNADGGEDSYQIDDELELQTYVAAAEESGKATFVVLLEGGYA